MTNLAADLMIANAEIKMLKAQLATVESRNKELECAYSAYDGSALQRADQHIEDQENAIKNLREQLAASQRSERAAVEDINAVRMCHTCKHFLREFGMGGIECKIPCVTIRHENFEWSGPQAGEESR